jgi:general secretion pathway protein H
MMSQTDAQAGFTLIEVICVLAIVGLLAALILPAIPRGTSQPRLAGYAVEVAALLKGDRNAAIRTRGHVATSLDAVRRIVISGATASIVQLPVDVTFEALLAKRCGDRRVGTTIDFFPSGVSCGGVIAIARQGVGYQIRVNWLTGGVEVVPTSKP